MANEILEICERMLLMEGAQSVSQLLIARGKGEPAALEQLSPSVYQELYKLARVHLRWGRPNQSLQPTALINEAYLRLLDQAGPIECEIRAHFFGIAAKVMRMFRVDHARPWRASKRGGDAAAVTLHNFMAVSPGRAPGVLEVDEGLDRLEAVDERKAKVVELRYFGGIDREEVASALGLTVPTVKRDLRLGKVWLRRFLAGQTP